MRLVYKLIILSKAKKYLKKLKNKPLKKNISAALYYKIKVNPYVVGNKEHGDLRGIYTYHLKFKGDEYRIAYRINDQYLIIPVIMIGSRENFYKQLKRYLHNS